VIGLAQSLSVTDDLSLWLHPAITDQVSCFSVSDVTRTKNLTSFRKQVLAKVALRALKSTFAFVHLVCLRLHLDFFHHRMPVLRRTLPSVIDRIPIHTQ
jgi:hypothetical protein